MLTTYSKPNSQSKSTTHLPLVGTENYAHKHNSCLYRNKLIVQGNTSPAYIYQQADKLTNKAFGQKAESQIMRDKEGEVKSL